jgi:rSAM/selenodomain-associated transferase 2
VGEVARLSIVVPVLNEAELLEEFLTHLRARAPGAEIVVVDGGSSDGTRAIAGRLAGPLRMTVVHSPRGRARQMNAGAAAAAGGVLWFLHADSRLPEGAVEALLNAVKEPGVVGGCFRIRIPRPEPIYRVSDSLGNLGVDLFRIALGDHGIFCRRSAFESVGGYPDVPLMEDAELYRGLARIGRVRQLRMELRTSARRYQRHGPARTTAAYALILALYCGGVSPEKLAALYARLPLAGRRGAGPSSG